MNREEKLKKIQETIQGIEKDFGKGSVSFGNTVQDVPIICSTGSIKIDSALGVGGIPKGRICEVYGPEASGKTSLCLSIMAEAQKKGEFCAFVDAEHALDPVWATNLGVNMHEVLISQPDCGEDALSIVEDFVESGSVGVIIVDSVAALVPKAELEGGMGDAHMALQARLMSQAMRKLTAKVAKSNCTILFTNQIRNSIGGYGNNEVVAGGNALKFYASIRFEVRRSMADSTKSDEEGMSTVAMNVKIVKNKVAPPFKKVQVELDTGVNGTWGFNIYKEVLDIASKEGLIKKGGAWYSYGDERIGQGKENASVWLKNNNEIFELLKSKIIEIVKSKNQPVIGSLNDELQKQVAEKEEKKRRKRNDKLEEDKEQSQIEVDLVEVEQDTEEDSEEESI